MIASIIRILVGAQARWAGVEPVAADGSIPQRIYFANHTSNLDAPVIWAALPRVLRKQVRPVAAEDYWQKGPIRRFLSKRIFHCVLIPRLQMSAHHNPITELEPALTAGASLILFPQGTRQKNHDGPIEPFKPGLWHLAKKHPQVQLVPAYLENLNRILPKGELFLVPLLAAVTFGPAIQIEPNENKEQFLKRARDALVKLVEGAAE